jgi:hypothetical protein
MFMIPNCLNTVEEVLVKYQIVKEQDVQLGAFFEVV